VSAKITIRELDGTEYQLKKRIAAMVLAAGYAREVQRGLYQMIGLSVYQAMRIVVSDTEGKKYKLNPEGRPECTLAKYPVKDQTSNPPRFGSLQDWSVFPSQPFCNRSTTPAVSSGV